MVAIAETLIERRSGAFEPASFLDRYQDALRELVEAKTKGMATTPRAIAVARIPGLAPPLRDLPPGCTFHPRCPQATDCCRTEKPIVRNVAGAQVACHLA